MNHLKRACILLLLGASTFAPAAAKGQGGGGAGGADPSGATEATSGRETRTEPNEAQSGMKEESPQRQEGSTPGVRSESVRHHRGLEGEAQGTGSGEAGENAPVRDAPTTTGGGT